MTNESMSDLLEELRRKANCSFLSDLHAKQYADAVGHAVEEIPPAAYSARAWSDVLRYIVGGSAIYSSQEAAHKALLAALKIER